MLTKKILSFIALIGASMFTTAQVSIQPNFSAGCKPLGVVINVTSPSAASISSYSWVITKPDGSTMTASSSQYVAIFTMPGQYDVSITVNGNNTSFFNNFITVYELPTAQFSISDDEGCFPLCATFTDMSMPGSGAIVQRNWDFGDGGTSTETEPQYCYQSVGTFSPVFSIQDNNGCVGSITMPALVHVTDNFPNVQFAMNETITCDAPVNVNINNTSTGNGTLTYNWSFGDNTSGTNSNPSFNHTFTSDGDFSVCLQATDATGCTSSTCHDLHVLADPTPSFTASGNIICAGSPISFTSTTPAPPTTYAWDFDGDNIVDATVANPTFEYSIPGTYYPTLTTTYGANCTGTFGGSIAITVLNEMTPQFTVDSTQACSAPFNVHFENTSTGPGTLSYSWSINNLEITTTENMDYSFSEYGTFDIALTVSNTQGCSETVTLDDLIVIQAPTLTFGTPATTCVGQNVDITSLNLTSIDPALQYYWDFNGNGTIDAFGPNPTYAFTTTGNFNINVSVQTVHGCTASYQKHIQVQADTQTDFTANTTYSCAGQSVEFCISGQPGNTYSWNFGDNSGLQFMQSDETCINHEFQDSGYFDITLTVFNGACSSSTVHENYIYITPPVAIFEYALNCNDLLNVTFANLSIESTEVLWDFGDGTTSTDQNPTHLFPSLGSYNVTLTAINAAYGCPDQAVNVVNIVAPNASIDFSQTQGCAPLNVQLSSTETNKEWQIEISNGISYHIVQDATTSKWIVEQDSLGIQVDSVQFNQYDNFWPQLEFNEPGCYDFTVTAFDANGCQNTSTFSDAICVLSNSDFADFTTTIINQCDSVSIQFTPIASNLTSVQWNFGDGVTSSELNPQHTFDAPYNYGQPLSVSLTASNNLGCNSTITQNLEIDFPVIPQFMVGNNPACLGDNVNFINLTSGPATGYTWDFGDPQSGANNTSNVNNPVHMFVGDEDNFTVCLTADNGHGCLRTKCTNNAVHIANPNVTFTYSANITNCLFGVQFDNTTQGTETAVNWNFGDGQIGIGQSTFHTYPIGVYDVTLVVTNNHGCTDSLTVHDILNYGDVIGPYSTVLDDANCAPFDVAFSSYNTNDTYFTYFWDFDDGNGDPTGNTTTAHTYTAPGTYCPSVIMTDPNGCNVYVPCENPIVVDEFVMTYSIPSNICAGDTIHAIIENGTTYTWNNTTDVSSGSSNGEFFIHPSNSIELILTGTYQDCEKIDTVNIHVNPLPNVTLTLDNEYCHNDALFGLYGGAPAGGVYTINGAPSLMFDPSVVAGDYALVYTYTDTLGCTNDASTNIVVHPTPTVSITDIADVCHDDSAFALSGGNPQGGIYQLDGVTVNTFDPSAMSLGNHIVEYFFTDNFGCTGSTTDPVNVNAVPQISVTFNTGCEDEALQIQNNSSIEQGAIASFNWSVAGLGNFSGATPQNIHFGSPGQYAVSLLAMSNHGCESPWDSLINVYETPIASFAAEFGCQGSELTFTDQSTLNSGSLASTIWGVEGQYIDSPNTLQHAFNSFGTLPVELIVVSDHGCNDTTSQDILVYPLPTVDITAQNNCDQTIATILSSSEIALGGITSYLWDFDGDIANQYAQDATVMFPGVGVYHFELTVTSNMGCTLVVNDSVEVFPIPDVDFLLDATTICEGENVMFFDLSAIPSPHNIAAWEWSKDGEVFSHVMNPNETQNEPGLWDIRLKVTTETGCVNDTVIQNLLQVNPKPMAGFTIGASELSMDTPLLSVIDGSSADVIAWTYNFGDGETEHFQNGDHLFAEWGEFEVTQTVTNVFGCSDTRTQNVSVTPALQVYIPNAFSPDDNGHNDTFYPVMHGDDVNLYEMSIFDRWGNKVFETKDQSINWNGTYMNNGKEAEQGAYNWKLVYRSKSNPVITNMTGSVVLLR